ncbi:MAG: hypothetical protein FWD94_01240 [Treponema sp.]|nr:hypothetical protein [Treponema sp.]
MAMNAKSLESDLKGDFIRINRECEKDSGISPDKYAEMMAESIASRLVDHITKYAEVTTSVTGSSVVTGVAAGVPVTGSGAVTGTGKGKVS